MTTSLGNLGSFRIERTEEYDLCPFDKSYCELIRVKGSKSEPSYNVVSHVYKYSENELALYLKDHKNYWKQLGDLLNEDIDISENELILRFPAEMFPKVAKIVPFVKKRGSGIQSDAFKQARARTQFRKKDGGIMKQKEQDSVITGMGQAITLDTFRGGIQ